MNDVIDNGFTSRDFFFFKLVKKSGVFFLVSSFGE